MPFSTGEKEGILPGIDYYFIPKHRDIKSYPNASHWVVNHKKEFDLAKESREKKYYLVDDRYSYNVYPDPSNNRKLNLLGIQNNNNEYIGRFEYDKDKMVMHGYPIDHTRDRKKPHNTILEKMLVDKKISKALKIRISRGQTL